jgi:hypothetical protein
LLSLCLYKALEEQTATPIAILMMKSEVIGKTTVTAAIANEPIHCPTKWCQLKY